MSDFVSAVYFFKTEHYAYASSTYMLRTAQVDLVPAAGGAETVLAPPFWDTSNGERLPENFCRSYVEICSF